MQSTTLSPIDKKAIAACIITACHVCAYERVRRECNRIMEVTTKLEIEKMQSTINRTIDQITPDNAINQGKVALSYQDRLAVSACEIMACGACPYESNKGECERVMMLQIERG